VRYNRALSKTNAARLLDQLGIRYEIREYEVDPDPLSG
jgi:Cys-tRNA(Pro)/Cys-tRNA(Cys) deacylase